MVISTDKLIYYTGAKISSIPHLASIDPALREGISLAARVFPFKVNSFVLDELIDWRVAASDPIFRLTFPQEEMIPERYRGILMDAVTDGKTDRIAQVVSEIRDELNPHSSDQMANVPMFEGKPVHGVQHKYEETVLLFPREGQTCHAYCSFCFRWPQFVDASVPRFVADEIDHFHAYLASRHTVSDVLLTGGDPMVLTTRRLTNYLEPLLRPEFAHIATIRIGTKALVYNPQRFLTDPDAADLLALLRRLVASGKHLAIMTHLNHWRELDPPMVQDAIAALQATGAVLRSQSPVLRGINDDAATWSRLWRKQVTLGIVPYYMFIERDTGAKHYFGLPISDVLDIYQSAVSQVSGLGRTARGPIMSASPGKVQILGRLDSGGDAPFILSFLQARRKAWLNRPFLAQFSDTAQWLSDLVPLQGGRFFFEDEACAEEVGDVHLLKGAA